MAEAICNTSPLQYLHQLGLLSLLQQLVERLIVPSAVVAELNEGIARGVNLPDCQTLPWIIVRRPVSTAVLPLVTDLGPGETEVLALGLESRDSIVILDDALARQIAETLGLKLIGTLGILRDAKRRGLISEVAPLLDQLQALRFRLAPHTRAAILKLVGE